MTLWVNQPVSQSVSQQISQSVSQTVSQTVSQWFGESGSRAYEVPVSWMQPLVMPTLHYIVHYFASVWPKLTENQYTHNSETVYLHTRTYILHNNKGLLIFHLKKYFASRHVHERPIIIAYHNNHNIIADLIGQPFQPWTNLSSISFITFFESSNFIIHTCLFTANEKRSVSSHIRFWLYSALQWP